MSWAKRSARARSNREAFIASTPLGTWSRNRLALEQTPLGHVWLRGVSRLEAFRQQPGKCAHRTILKCLDGTLVLSHCLCCLRHGEALQEAQHDAFLLLRVELFYRCQQGDISDVVDDRGLRAALGSPVFTVGVKNITRGDLEPVPAGFE